MGNRSSCEAAAEAVSSSVLRLNGIANGHTFLGLRYCLNNVEAVISRKHHNEIGLRREIERDWSLL